ncbi:ABSCISIC ACID-INSENSITIVE 5-like protein 2 [Canna indica]|uniref:ABSCISIC ACID-INSENSITIVE 5-like protein 2 n=1 Tax=Canna indica TaxID=4628 RepID=A0AAQ3KDJ7_9LILI|nr:ABSCISIC ACID-INSENSITIVE 5-like protein 2 [Canna indica]
MGMTMATQGVGGGQQSKVQSLARQGSIYNLTLNEVQSHLGEPLHSMNLDELLKSVFPGEDTQSSGADAAAAQCPVIQREGSLTMPRALSKKTVDEVWRHIQQEQKENGDQAVGDYRRRPALGEMTLEDFLSKAGVVAEGADKSGRSNQIGNVGFAPRAHWLQHYQQQQAQQSIMGAFVAQADPQPLAVGNANILDTMYHEGEGANSSPFNPQTPRRKRGAVEDVAKKTVERRQKRMIKNRESAARSRARKQAYTHELENKVSRLEEENQRLRQQRELDAMMHCVPQPEPKHQLRRTSSAPF